VNGSSRARRSFFDVLHRNSEKPPPGVPWGQIAGMRDKVIHDDMGGDVELVRDDVNREFSALSREAGSALLHVPLRR